MLRNEISFGRDIYVHEYFIDKESWYLTIRKLQIHGIYLCKKTCTNEEIARYINVRLHENLNTLNSIIKEITPFTAPNDKE